MGGVQGEGAYVILGNFRNLDFRNLDFRNRAQGSGRVGRGDDFPLPHLGVPPLVRAGGVRQGQNFLNFWDDQNTSKNIIFPKSTAKTFFKSSAAQLPFCDFFLTDSKDFSKYFERNFEKNFRI